MKGELLREFFQERQRLESVDSHFLRLKTIILKAPNSELSDNDATKIKKIYAEREREILNSAVDYVNCFFPINKAWTDLAEALCGDGKLFNMHYYQLLYAKLTNVNDLEIVTQDRFNTIPLENLMVSEDGKTLICWKSVLEYALVNHGVLASYEERIEGGIRKTTLHTLTPAEADFIKARSPTDWLAIEKLKKQAENFNRSLSKLTVLALIRLVECSTFKSGQRGAYSPEEEAYAYEAYDHFTLYLKSLSDKEHAFLMGQMISSGTNSQVFGTLWQLIIKNQICVYWANTSILRLILDYEPTYSFKNKDLNDLIASQHFSHVSERKSYEVTNPFKTKELMAANLLAMLEVSVESTSEYHKWILEMAFDYNGLIEEGKLYRAASVIDEIYTSFQTKLDTPLPHTPLTDREFTLSPLEDQRKLSMVLSSLSSEKVASLINKLLIPQFINAFSQQRRGDAFFPSLNDKNDKPINTKALTVLCKIELEKCDNSNHSLLLNRLYNFLKLESGYVFHQEGLRQADELYEKYIDMISATNRHPSFKKERSSTY